MEIKNNTGRLLEKPLPELLEKFYAMKAIQPFAQRYVFPLFPDLADLEKPRKRDLVEAFARMEKDVELRKSFVEGLPDLLYEAIGILVWEHMLPLDHLEKRLEATISYAFEGRLRYQEHAIRLEDDFVLLANGPKDTFRSPGREKEDFFVLLPRALRDFFKEVYPKPKHYDWQPVEIRKELPPEIRHFNAEASVATDLGILGDYLRRGGIKFTQSGKPTVAALRTLAATTEGGEFFPEDKSSRKLPELRHRLLLAVVRSLDDEGLQALTRRPFPAGEVFRGLLERLFTRPGFFMENVLSHLKGSSPLSWEYLYNGPLEQLRGIFASLPEGGWVTTANLYEYLFYRELDCLPFDPDHWQFHADDDSPAVPSFYYGYARMPLRADNLAPFAILPMLFGTSFLLAALGMAEIHYTAPPVHEDYFAKGETFISPFDGLIALRLTPLGLFALGRTEELTLAQPTSRRAEVRLHPQRMVASCSDPDPVTATALEEFMERLAPGIYRMTADSLLGNCADKEQLAARIEAFRERIPAEIPPNWEAFFKEHLEVPAPLESQNAYFLYRIADSERLRRLFSTDPVLRGIGIKAEGWRLALTPEEHRKLRNRLRQLGYLVETDRPSTPRTESRKKSPRKRPRRRRW